MDKNEDEVSYDGRFFQQGLLITTVIVFCLFFLAFDSSHIKPIDALFQTDPLIFFVVSLLLLLGSLFLLGNIYPPITLKKVIFFILGVVLGVIMGVCLGLFTCLAV